MLNKYSDLSTDREGNQLEKFFILIIWTEFQFFFF